MIYAGQGHLAPDVFRIAHMGDIHDDDIERLCAAFESILAAARRLMAGIRTAVILAAGQGTRLREEVRDQPKGFLRLGDRARSSRNPCCAWPTPASMT